MQNNPANINQVAIGNFMVTGRDLRTIRRQYRMRQGRRANRGPLGQVFHGDRSGEQEAIAPLGLPPHQFPLPLLSQDH
jgi:hypothetical protein